MIKINLEKKIDRTVLIVSNNKEEIKSYQEIIKEMLIVNDVRYISQVATNYKAAINFVKDMNPFYILLSDYFPIMEDQLVCNDSGILFYSALNKQGKDNILLISGNEGIVEKARFDKCSAWVKGTFSTRDLQNMISSYQPKYKKQINLV